MSRVHSALVLLFVLGSCRALPSASPLADTGEGRLLEDGALSRNRIPLGERKSHGADADDDSSSGADDTVVILANAADAGDGGALDGGVATFDAGDGGLGWAGEYYGSDKQVTRLEGKSEKVDLDDKAHTRVEEPSPGIVLISLVSSADGQVICGVRARVKEKRAELEPGEACPALYFRLPLVLTGSAELDGDELEVDVEGHGEVPGEDGTLDIDVEYHFDGKRR